MNDFATAEALEGAETCLNWGLNEDGTYAEQTCATSDADGAVTFADVPGDTQVLIESGKDTYMDIIATLEVLNADVNFAVVVPPVAAVLGAAALAGLTVDETKGHVSVFVWNLTMSV